MIDLRAFESTCDSRESCFDAEPQRLPEYILLPGLLFLSVRLAIRHSQCLKSAIHLSKQARQLKASH